MLFFDKISERQWRQRRRSCEVEQKKIAYTFEIHTDRNKLANIRKIIISVWRSEIISYFFRSEKYEIWMTATESGFVTRKKKNAKAHFDFDETRELIVHQSSVFMPRLKSYKRIVQDEFQYVL